MSLNFGVQQPGGFGAGNASSSELARTDAISRTSLHAEGSSLVMEADILRDIGGGPGGGIGGDQTIGGSTSDEIPQECRKTTIRWTTKFRCGSAPALVFKRSSRWACRAYCGPYCSHTLSEVETPYGGCQYGCDCDMPWAYR